MAVDTQGNVYVGFYISEPGSADVGVNKYNSSGQQVYSVVIHGGGMGGYVENITTDSSGNAYVLRNDYDDYSFYTIEKLSPTGKLLATFDASFTVYDESGSILSQLRFLDIKVVGNALYAVGEKLYYNADYDTLTGTDIAAVKYTLNGAVSWKRTIGTKVRDVGTTITADTTGNVYAVGVTRGSLAAQNRGNDDIVMRKLSASGSTLWTKQFGNASYDQADDIIAYSSSELYLTGTTSGALEGGSYHGGKDAFLLRRDGNGNKVWTDQ